MEIKKISQGFVQLGYLYHSRLDLRKEKDPMDQYCMIGFKYALLDLAHIKKLLRVCNRIGLRDVLAGGLCRRS